jgi:transcriptional regulator with XRE-family HTH domain
VLEFIGGAEGDRTPDLMTASHALSQLSYGPLRISDLRSTVRRVERMNLESLFQQFLFEKLYIQNVSQNTIWFYEQSFKTFNLQDPLTKSQLSERVTAMREAGKSAACCDAYIRGINPFLTWLFENEHRLDVEDFISHKQLSKYELGITEPPLIVLLRYARVAGVYVDVLIDDELDLPARLPSNHRR